MHRIFLSPAGSIEAFERIAEEYRHNAAVRPRSSGLQPSASPQLPEVTSRAGLALKHGAGRFVRRVQSYELLRGLHNCQQTNCWSEYPSHGWLHADAHWSSSGKSREAPAGRAPSGRTRSCISAMPTLQKLISSKRGSAICDPCHSVLSMHTGD